MDYQKQYTIIIRHAILQNRIKHNGIYYENHHVIPKCLDGSDEKENLILLTFKEHFLCHKLLTYIYPHDRKIACAYHKMAFSKKNKCHISARNYVYAKELISLIPMSEETKEKIKISNTGRIHSEESKAKMSKKLKGKLASNKGKKMSEEQKLKLSLSHKGKPRIISIETRKKMRESAKKKPHVSIETRKKMSEKRQGKLNPMAGKLGINNPNFGSIRSEETRKKISTSNKNKQRTIEQKEKYRLMNLGRNHSKETKEKIRSSCLGKVRGSYKKRVRSNLKATE